MSTPNTGYVVNNYGGVSGNNLDLAKIFKSGTSSVTTGYKISNGNDIGTIFTPWDGSIINQASLTGYKYNGKDLEHCAF